MLLVAIVAAVLLVVPSTVADVPGPSQTPQPAARRVGEKLDYSLHALLSQTVVGKDTFGKTVNQTTPPTSLHGHETIIVTAISGEGVTLHRVGTLSATIDDTKPIKTTYHGWTLVDQRGRLVRDSGKLGGLFLLPLPFLGQSAVKAGDDLAVGDTWTGKLDIKLYAMTAQPKMTFVVSGVRSVLGVHVFTIKATGTVPMHEPVSTPSGEPLGYGTGIAKVTVEFDYDRDNRRLISMQTEVSDSLRYSGLSKHAVGRVHDHQTCLVALDPSSMTSVPAPAPVPNASATP